jgi:tRNA threonylcarbamoyladenosine biosynthesis protein TsaB
MHILAVDTASNAGGVALSRNSEVIGLHMAKTPLKYSEKLIEWVAFLLKQHELALADIGLFAVASGPGSFTGLRIGLAAAKAFAQTLGRPAVGISSLEALAYRFRHVSDTVAPVVDARRQQVYAAVYRVTSAGAEMAQPETISRPEPWLRSLPQVEPGKLVFVGDGATLYASTIVNSRPGSRIIASDNCILAELCQLGSVRHGQGIVGDASSLAANYLRPPDVQIKTPGGAKGARAVKG